MNSLLISFVSLFHHILSPGSFPLQYLKGLFLSSLLGLVLYLSYPNPHFIPLSLLSHLQHKIERSERIKME